MKDNMNGLAKKFLGTLKAWIDKRIPEKTKDCLRTKVAVILKKNDNLYDVILASDYGTYLSLVEERNAYKRYEALEKKTSLTQAEEAEFNKLKNDIRVLYDDRRLTQALYEKEVSLLTLEELVTIRTDTYSVGDYVIIGIIDNKLTNSFILYKSVKKGE